MNHCVMLKGVMLNQVDFRISSSTLLFKILHLLRCFLKDVSYIHQACYYLITSTVKQQYYKILLESEITVSMYSCDAKLNCQHHYFSL